MKKLLIILCMVVLVAAPVASFAKKKSEIPQTTIEGLVLVPDTTGIARGWTSHGVPLHRNRAKGIENDYSVPKELG
jgi:hypothetical protein